MTNHYLRNAVPDHIAGVISACEGIQNNLVLLNGPIGCKTYYTFSGVDSLIRRSNLWTLGDELRLCLLYTSPSPRDGLLSRMPSSA